MKQKIIQQGAEAIISLQDNKITKHRIKKAYRLPELDEKIRKRRTRSEAKIIEKLKEQINVPKIISTDNKEIIKMEFINGQKLSDSLDSFPLAKQKQIIQKIAEQTAKLHNIGIIHGDLTTSNMMLVEEKKVKQEKASKLNKDEEKVTQDCKKLLDNTSLKVFFIDFGLSFHSNRIEDKAVDLHLLRQALEAKHFKNWEALFSKFLKAYKSKDKTKILEQLKKVESRGRYKH